MEAEVLKQLVSMAGVALAAIVFLAAGGSIADAATINPNHELRSLPSHCKLIKWHDHAVYPSSYGTQKVSCSTAHSVAARYLKKRPSGKGGYSHGAWSCGSSDQYERADGNLAACAASGYRVVSIDLIPSSYSQHACRASSLAKALRNANSNLGQRIRAHACYRGVAAARVVDSKGRRYDDAFVYLANRKSWFYYSDFTPSGTGDGTASSINIAIFDALNIYTFQHGHIAGENYPVGS